MAVSRAPVTTPSVPTVVVVSRSEMQSDCVVASWYTKIAYQEVIQMKRPEIKTFNSWREGNRVRHTPLDIQLGITVFGISLFFLEVLLYRKLFAYELYFGLFGFGISFSGE